MKTIVSFSLLFFFTSVLAISLNPATTSTSSGGIVYSPTKTSSAGFPIVMHYTTGTFSTTPGKYYCYLATSGFCKFTSNVTSTYLYVDTCFAAGFSVPATVWASDPSVLQCASFGHTFPASGSDIALYVNTSGAFTQLASWPASYDNTADASTTVTNRYSAVVMNPVFYNFSTSVPVSMTITPKTAFPGLSASGWYVCVWNVYNLPGESQPGNFFVPENAVTNFTVCTCISSIFPSIYLIFPS